MKQRQVIIGSTLLCWLMTATPSPAQGGSSGSNVGRYAAAAGPSVITGRVTDSKGSPVNEATVTTFDGHFATTDAAGNYTFTLDAAGVYTVTAQTAAGSAARRVQVNTGETVTADLSLRTVLYFPSYQAQAPIYAGFAVSNYSTQTAALQFTAFGTDGQTLPYAVNPALFQLPAQNQLARLGSEIFGVNPQSLQSGWVQLVSDNPGVGSFFLAGSDLQLDGSVAFQRQAQQLFFTRIFQGAAAFHGQVANTVISLANPNDHPVSLRLLLKGAQNLERIESVSARGFLRRSIAELFGSTQSFSGAYLDVQVTEGDGIVGFQFVELPARGTIFGLSATVAAGASDSYSAQMASGLIAAGTSFFTDLKLVNTSGQARQMTVDLINENGGQLAATLTVALPAGALFERDMSDAFALGSSISGPSRVGSIRVRADGPGVVGDVVFGDPVSFRFASSLPLQTRLFTKAVFSQVANAAGFYTGLAFHNPGAVTSDITIEVYSEQGRLTGQTLVSLLTGRRISRLLTELVPATAGQLRGYILVSATQPLIAQQVFGDTAGSFLSAVPPTVIQ